MRRKRMRAALSPRLEALEGRALLSTGINVVRNTAGMNNREWVDARMTFGPWKALPGGLAPALTADEYPTGDAQATSGMLDYPDGVFHLSWRGTATVTLIGMDAQLGPVTVGPDGVSRADAQVAPSLGGKLNVQVTGLDPSAPFDDFRMISPGYAADTTQVYKDEFLQRLAPFSIIRFMDFTATNQTTDADWSDRPTPEDWDQSDDGVAWEYAIAMANASGKDVWINVPDQATDDYVDHLAQLLRDQLNPGAKVYVEYSNELWSSATLRYKRVVAQAWANPLLTSTSEYGRAAQQSAFRLMQIGAIFRADYGDRAGQVLPVFGGQAGWTHFAEVGLGYINATFGPPSDYFSALAIAPYVNLDEGDDKSGLTMNALFGSMEDQLESQLVPAIEANAALAARYGLGLDAYEGGQALQSENGKNQNLKIAAQDDPRMGAIYRELLSAWSQASDGPFMLYDLASGYGKYGSWGLLPDLAAPGSVKWDTMMHRLLPGGDATLDGRVDAADFAALAAHFGQSGQWWQQGDFNGDHRVDQADLDILRADLGPVTPTEAVAIALFQAPRTVIAGLPVTLNQAGQAGGLSFEWTLSSGGPFLDGSTGAPFSFVADAAGSYVVTLTVGDDAGDSATGSVTIAATAADGAPLFQDSFGGTDLSSAWTAGGGWVVNDGVVSQTSTAESDGLPKKARLTDQDYPADATIVARVRVDQWVPGNAARVGVSLENDTRTRLGYDLAFHGSDRVQFFDGTVAGNAFAFDWSRGVWYWFALSSRGGTLYGKVWQDGTPEPVDWMFSQAGWGDRDGGAPALLGGQSDGQSYALASFDDVTVRPTAGPAGLRAGSASSRQVDLDWDAVAGAVGYAIERSPAGLNQWTQIRTTTTATSLRDTSIRAGMSYDYRVRARDSSGDSAVVENVATVAVPIGSLLYADEFLTPDLSPAWIAGTSWVQQNGILSQTSIAPSSGPAKARLIDQDYPADVTIVAEVRVDQWKAGDAARVGVSLNTDATRKGYDLVFHGKNHVQFYDGTKKGNSFAFNWSRGVWYWFALSSRDGTLYGKVWQDGTPEPVDWMFTQAGWSDRNGGSPALLGGQASTTSYARASFDRVEVLGD